MHVVRGSSVKESQFTFGTVRYLVSNRSCKLFVDLYNLIDVISEEERDIRRLRKVVADLMVNNNMDSHSNLIKVVYRDNIKNDVSLFVDCYFVYMITLKSKDLFGFNLLTNLSEIASYLIRLNMTEIKLTENAANEYLVTSKKENSKYAITQIASKYGMTAFEMNKFLSKKGVIKKVNNQWVPTRLYLNVGFMITEEIIKNDDKKILHTYWTEKGLEFIDNIMREEQTKGDFEQLELFQGGDF